MRRSTTFANVRKSIVRCLFRTFDQRWIALTKDVVDWPRLDVMACVGAGHLGLLCSRQQSVPGFRHALVVDAPVNMFCLSNKSREGQTLFPLFVHDGGGLLSSAGHTGSRVNIGEKFKTQLMALLAAEAAKATSSELTKRDAMDALGYIYATLHSQEYRRRYADLLKMDYPRVPCRLARSCFAR